MAARKRGNAKTSGGRGSPEAIEKRRTARQLNTLLSGGSKASSRLDGRTEKRRQRLVKELKAGRRGTPLKPIDFVSHVNELLQIGETLGSLRKQGVKPRKVEATPAILDIARRTQKAYEFRTEAWKLLGLEVGDGKGATKAAAKKRTRRARKRKG